MVGSSSGAGHEEGIVHTGVHARINAGRACVCRQARAGMAVQA